MRPSLNLHNLNKYITYVKFHLVTIASVLPTLNHNDWLAVLDLQDTYFHVAISPSHKWFLRFVLAGQHGQYTVLPFGLSSALCDQMHGCSSSLAQKKEDFIQKIAFLEAVTSTRRASDLQSLMADPP